MAHEQQDYIDGWLTYSEWIDGMRNDSDIFQRLDNDTAFRDEILACQTNYERFELFWNNPEIRNELEKYSSKDVRELEQKQSKRLSVKSVSESKRMRDLGNQSFKNGKYLEALNRYTQAVRFAPYPGPDQQDADTLSLALANRSAALFSLTRYRLCLLDIDLALKYGYPEANKFKLLIRKVKCLHILSVWANDVEQIKEDLKAMLNKPGTKEFIKVEINNMFEFLEQMLPESVEKDESDVEDENVIKISNVSKSLPQAADCVELSCDPDKGRYLLTNKDVSFGRLLIAEDPFVCNLAPSKRNQHCYHCFGKLHSCGLSCEVCTQIFYCSIECLQANAPIHRYECNKLLDFQEKLGVVYLVTHIMFKVDFKLKTIPIQTKKTIDEKTLDDVIQIPGSTWPDLVYKNDYAAVLSLMDHASDYDYDALMGYTLTAVYLTITLKKLFADTHPDLLSSEKSQLVTGSVLLRHILQLQTNLISILNQNLQGLVSVGHSISDMEEEPIGIGLYPTVALLNHSCQPNILSIFHKNKFVVRASGSLECGTEINYCYGPSFSRMSKKDRQMRLKEQYFFTCNCDCCANNKENVGRALVCPECEGPVIYNQDLSHRCMDCGKENLMDVKARLTKVGELRAGLEKLPRNQMDQKKKLSKLNEIETKLARLVHWRNPLFVQIKSQKISCAEDQEDFEAAIKYCKEGLELSDKTYGENSFESIMTVLKYINLDWQRLFYMIEESDKDEVKQAGVADLKTLLAKVGATRGKLRDLLNSTSILGAESTFDAELKFLSDISSSINGYLSNLTEPSEETRQQEAVAEASVRE